MGSAFQKSSIGTPVAINKGGTNSTTALNSNRIMTSQSGAIKEAGVMGNGKILIGSTGSAPVIANITAGTNITITNGAGSIEISAAGGSSALTLIPHPNGAVPDTGNADSLYPRTIGTSTTVMRVGQVIIPFAITANKITIRNAGNINTAGTYDLTLYSEDGQTQIFSVTTATISSPNVSEVIALSSVSIPAGIYYIAMNSNGGDCNFMFWADNNVDAGTDGVKILSVLSGEPTLEGTYTITAGEPPATLTLSSISYSTSGAGGASSTLYFRLDN